MFLSEEVLILGGALLLTVILEVVAAVILKVRNKWDLILIALVNCITNPILNGMMAVVNDSIPFIAADNLNLYEKFSSSTVYTIEEAARIICLLILEIIVVIAEGIFYKKFLEYKKHSPMLLSFLLNLISFVLGTTLFFFLIMMDYF